MFRLSKYKDILKQNIVLKIGSVIIAFIIWLTVVNVSNPEITDTVVCVLKVDYAETMEKMDTNYTIDTQNVRVTYKVRNDDIRAIDSSDFTAYVDLRDYTVTGALPVYVSVDDSVSSLVKDVTANPIVVHVTTENMQEKEFPITVTTTGDMADGYECGDAVLDPGTLTLYGPESEIGHISSVGIEVDVSGISSDIDGTAEPVFYDANGSSISISDKIVVKDTISYSIPVYKKKTISITVQTSGTPAAGYSLDTAECDPGFVEVYGDDVLLSSVNGIILPGTLLDISGATNDVTASINIADYLPSGLYTKHVGNVALAARITRNGAAPRENPPGQRSEDGDGNTETTSNTAENNNSEENEFTGSAGSESGETGESGSAGEDTAVSENTGSGSSGALDTGDSDAGTGDTSGSDIVTDTAAGSPSGDSSSAGSVSGNTSESESEASAGGALSGNGAVSAGSHSGTGTGGIDDVVTSPATRTQT